MTDLFTLLISAIIIESVIQGFKFIKTSKGINYKKIASLLLGVLVAFGASLNIFEILGLNMNEYIGIVLTGLIIGQGSGVVNDLRDKLNKTRIENTSTK